MEAKKTIKKELRFFHLRVRNSANEFFLIFYGVFQRILKLLSSTCSEW